jgi:glutathione S-transferase
MIKLYDHPLSGNCFKVKLLLTQAGLTFETRVVDVFKGENLTTEFKKINPAAKIPVIDDDGYTIWESNAILIYLAERYAKDYLPTGIEARGTMFKWLLFNKTSLDPYLAKSRAILKFMPEGKRDFKELDSLQAQGKKSLEIFDEYLEGRRFIVDDYSIADIAFYPYIKLCHEGNIDLKPFRNVLLWIANVENTDNFLNIP